MISKKHSIYNLTEPNQELDDIYGSHEEYLFEKFCSVNTDFIDDIDFNFITTEMLVLNDILKHQPKEEVEL